MIGPARRSLPSKRTSGRRGGHQHFGVKLLKARMFVAASVLALSASVAIAAQGSGSGASYPPCKPGPGDDRCIQTYERGVGRAGAAKAAASGAIRPIASRRMGPWGFDVAGMDRTVRPGADFF